MTDKAYYWYGLAMLAYVLSCWFFSVIRAFHTCQQTKEQRAYLWPDRKLQITIYLMATCLLPYIADPTNPAAWQLVKSYFPATNYFYCGVLIFMFFGSVKQWNKWRSVSWVMAMLVIVAMIPLIISACLPAGFLNEGGLKIQHWLVLAVSLITIPYCAVSMWKVWNCIVESRDDNYSNPDDFPLAYAKRVWLSPLILTPFIWPAFLTNSPSVMAWMCIPLTVFNIVLLINVMPAWRHGVIFSESEEQDEEEESHEHMIMDERVDKIAQKIKEFMEEKKGFLDPHLKMEQVVSYCGTNRTYLSLTFKERFGGFYNYVNRLRLEHYEQYLHDNPKMTKETAAQESGFNSYQAYYKACQRLKNI